MSEKLLPCPWCGGEPERINCSVHCNNAYCEAQPFTAGQSQAEAAKAWNTRAQTPPPAVLPVVASELRDAAAEAEIALTAMLRQFTKTPSNLSDTVARCLGHKAQRRLSAAIAAASTQGGDKP